MVLSRPDALALTESDGSAIQEILETDRIWCAYALADLEPEHQPYAQWSWNQSSIVLRYSGLNPPILFAHGEPTQVIELLSNIPRGTYQMSLPANLIGSIPASMEVPKPVAMWRMYLSTQPEMRHALQEIRRLTAADLPQIEKLYQSGSDAPDGFHQRQLDMGPFAGVWYEGRLAATAGVHVHSSKLGVTAIGNVFTHPSARRRGLARAGVLAVLGWLEPADQQTIVLNVSQENYAGITLYQELGFEIHCDYFEGIIVIGTGQA